MRFCFLVVNANISFQKAYSINMSPAIAGNGKEKPPTDKKNDISRSIPISKHSPTQNTHFG